jgi:hypothetical protein
MSKNYRQVDGSGGPFWSIPPDLILCRTMTPAWRAKDSFDVTRRAVVNVSLGAMKAMRSGTSPSDRQ